MILNFSSMVNANTRNSVNVGKISFHGEYDNNVVKFQLYYHLELKMD